MEIWDTIVVGAGIEGSATAYRLAKDCHHMTLLLEQFSVGHSKGCSHGRNRIIRKSYPEDFFANMMVEAYDAWKKLEEEEQTQLYMPTGLLAVAKSDCKMFQGLEDRLRSLRSKYDRLDSVGLAKRFRAAKFDADHLGLFEYDAGLLLADKCLAGFQNQFKKSGGVIRDGEEVLKVVPVSEELVRVVTTKGEYSARSVVVAAGPWANKVLQSVDLQLPLKPLRVLVWFWKQLDEGLGIENGFPVFIHVEGRNIIFGHPSFEHPGLAKVAYHGGQELESPDQRDSAPKDDRCLNYVTDFVKRHLPGLESQPSVIENCMYTMCPDDSFILDRHPKWKNIVIGTGFSGHGFKFAPIVGKVLAELATGKAPSHDLAAFSISRFGKSS